MTSEPGDPKQQVPYHTLFVTQGHDPPSRGEHPHDHKCEIYAQTQEEEDLHSLYSFYQWDTTWMSGSRPEEIGTRPNGHDFLSSRFPAVKKFDQSPPPSPAHLMAKLFWSHREKLHTDHGARLNVSWKPSSTTYCVTLGMLVNLSVPQVFHQQMKKI